MPINRYTQIPEYYVDLVVEHGLPFCQYELSALQQGRSSPTGNGKFIVLDAESGKLSIEGRMREDKPCNPQRDEPLDITDAWQD